MNPGSMWVRMILASVAPASRPAATKSASRNSRNLPRTTRARLVHATSEMITVMPK